VKTQIKYFYNFQVVNYFGHECYKTLKNAYTARASVLSGLLKKADKISGRDTSTTEEEEETELI